MLAKSWAKAQMATSIPAPDEPELFRLAEGERFARLEHLTGWGSKV
jgi:hypothetical protein